MKAFVKLQCDIVDRFDSIREQWLFTSMLCLMDREGRIRMDSAALAARLKCKKEMIQDTLERLMEPNAQSKCKKHRGACVAFLDPEQPHLGFVIPAAVSHRKSNADTERRRAYRRAWMKSKRPSRAKNRGEQGRTRGEQGRTRGELPPPSKVNKGEHGVNKGEHGVNCDRDRDREYLEKSHVDVRLHTTPSKDLQDPDLIHSVDEVLELLCEKVYAGKLRKNQIGQETVRQVAEMLPFSREQIELVGDYHNLPPDDCWPELKKRRSLAFNQLIRYWADQVSVAVLFDQKYFSQ